MGLHDIFRIRGLWSDVAQQAIRHFDEVLEIIVSDLFTVVRLYPMHFFDIIPRHVPELYL